MTPLICNLPFGSRHAQNYSLQLVERGSIDLDEDITRVLHEYKDPQVLVGFKDDGEPITRSAKNKMTLRHLLTHSSGIGYDFLNADLQQYRLHHGLSVPGKGESLTEWAFVPLLFEPGEGWSYGYSMDWVGAVVERIGAHGTLEEYMSKNIWEPLQMHSTTFRFKDRLDISSPERLVTLLERNSKGHIEVASMDPTTKTFHFNGGGSGLFSSPTDYVSLLSSLLRNDGIALKPETRNLLFEPVPGIGRFVKEFLYKVPENVRDGFLGGFTLEQEYTWAMGGLLAMEDLAFGRKKGSLSWAGMPNHSWWIDPSSDLYGLYATKLSKRLRENSKRLYIKNES
ncbi:hypothetical protein VKT23_001709 [Stygiomarasmius scandens]|uniref:Beta-lactamase-related domain-containing protein n=1 Tax=Marasmiellus scandens TaxID=2682957 RepID=A0ABR1K121_9AGAR